MDVISFNVVWIASVIAYWAAGITLGSPWLIRVLITCCIYFTAVAIVDVLNKSKEK